MRDRGGVLNVSDSFIYHESFSTEMTEKMSKDEQIGFHKGSLSTLAKEREELLRIIRVVEQLMQMHIKALQDLGVDLKKIAENEQKKKKIDEMI